MDESHKSLGVWAVQSNSMSTSVFTRCMPLEENRSCIYGNNGSPTVGAQDRCSAQEQAERGRAPLKHCTNTALQLANVSADWRVLWLSSFTWEKTVIFSAHLSRISVCNQSTSNVCEAQVLLCSECCLQKNKYTNIYIKLFLKDISLFDFHWLSLTLIFEANSALDYWIGSVGSSVASVPLRATLYQ